MALAGEGLEAGGWEGEGEKPAKRRGPNSISNCPGKIKAGGVGGRGVVSSGVPFKFKAKDLGDPGAHALTLTSFNLAQAFPQLADFTKDPSIPASDHLICT